MCTADLSRTLRTAVCVLATTMGLVHADYLITEAGFGADLGAGVH